MAADVTRIIGIDFGTSTSVVRVKRYKNGEPVGDSFFSSAVTFGNGQGDSKAVTAVRRNSDGSFTCGREAEDMAPGGEIFREFKMELESPDGEKRAAARAVTEEFFQYLYRWYDHQRSDMGEAGDVEKTIVSFPVKWTEVTRRFMVEAAQKAGFPDVSGMDEPTAALYATLARKMNDVSAKGLLRAGEPGYMLLIDMGAGTSDLAVCRYTMEDHGSIIRAGQIKNEVVATWPESADAPTFGGREVDRLLEDYLTDYLSSCGLDGAMARQLVCGAASVKPWKENTVSALLGEGKRVDACGFLSGYMMLLPQKKPFPAIDRAKFEAMLGGKLTGFQSLVSGCLDRACELVPDVAENGLDLVILTGGHSAWYFTEGLLSGAMPGISHRALDRVQAERDRVLRLSNPQETVALGLVYSQLPLKVEDGKKEAEGVLKGAREDTERRAQEEAGGKAVEKSGQGPGGGETGRKVAGVPLIQGNAAYVWDNRLISTIEMFFSQNCAAYGMVFNRSRQKSRLSIPAGDRILRGGVTLLHRDEGHGIMSAGKVFGNFEQAVCKSGLYVCINDSKQYMTWAEFINGTLPAKSDTCVRMNDEFFLSDFIIISDKRREKERSFWQGLQDCLRKESLRLSP